MPAKSVSQDSLAAAPTGPEYSGKKLRVAVIGCGGISQLHLAAFKAFADVEVKLAPEATAIMATRDSAKSAPTILLGDACQRAEMRCMVSDLSSFRGEGDLNPCIGPAAGSS